MVNKFNLLERRFSLSFIRLMSALIVSFYCAVLFVGIFGSLGCFFKIPAISFGSMGMYLGLNLFRFKEFARKWTLRLSVFCLFSYLLAVAVISGRMLVYLKQGDVARYKILVAFDMLPEATIIVTLLLIGFSFYLAQEPVKEKFK